VLRFRAAGATLFFLYQRQHQERVTRRATAKNFLSPFMRWTHLMIALVIRMVGLLFFPRWEIVHVKSDDRGCSLPPFFSLWQDASIPQSALPDGDAAGDLGFPNMLIRLG